MVAVESGMVSFVRNHVAEVLPYMLSASVQLQDRGDVVFVDCSSRFNPYLMGGAAGVNLKHVSLARASSLHELKEFILNRLEEYVTSRGCRVLLVNCINEFDTSPKAWFIRRLVEEKIRELTRKYDLTTIVSLSWKHNLTA